MKCLTSPSTPTIKRPRDIDISPKIVQPYLSQNWLKLPLYSTRSQHRIKAHRILNLVLMAFIIVNRVEISHCHNLSPKLDDSHSPINPPPPLSPLVNGSSSKPPLTRVDPLAMGKSNDSTYYDYYYDSLDKSPDFYDYVDQADSIPNSPNSTIPTEDGNDTTSKLSHPTPSPGVLLIGDFHRAPDRPNPIDVTVLPSKPETIFHVPSRGPFAPKPTTLGQSKPRDQSPERSEIAPNPREFSPGSKIGKPLAVEPYQSAPRQSAVSSPPDINSVLESRLNPESRPRIMSFEAMYRDRLMMDLNAVERNDVRAKVKSPQDRYFTLHNACSSMQVQVFGRRVNAKASSQPHTLKFAKFYLETVGLDGKTVRIKNAYTGRYICYDRQGRITATSIIKRRGLCDFTQLLTNHHFKYRSAYHPTWFLGFDPKGNPILGKRSPGGTNLATHTGENVAGENYDRCFRFTKVNRSAPHYNSFDAKRFSTDERRRPQSLSFVNMPIFNSLFNKPPALLHNWQKLGAHPKLPPAPQSSVGSVTTVVPGRKRTTLLPPFLRNYLLEEARRDRLDEMEDDEYFDY